LRSWRINNDVILQIHIHVLVMLEALEAPVRVDFPILVVPARAFVPLLQIDLDQRKPCPGS
jgi:hypothetical protein